MAEKPTTDGIRRTNQPPVSPPRVLPRPVAPAARSMEGVTRPVSLSTAASATHTPPKPSATEAAADVEMGDLSSRQPTKRPTWLKWLLISIGGLVALLIAAAVGALVWYQQQLRPVTEGSKERVRIEIIEGSGPSQIATQLQSAGVIRSHRAFSIYTKLSGTENTLKAGTYHLGKGESVQQIVDHLVSGKQDTFTIMFLPGDTLANHRKKLESVGYSEQEIDAAFDKQYQRPLLFDGKPAGSDLEGYIFGDSYDFTSDASVEMILNRTFDEFESYIKKNNLVEALKQQNMNLYQGITLASIVQREVTNKQPNTPTNDQEQVARVFMNRMKAGMTLGSDVTYQYAARKMGVEPTPLLQSPYNTRIHTGLPPGPIASPGLGALLAVAHPGTNDYLFFLSGDDDVTYFGKTDADHQKNIEQHCKVKCLIN